MISWEFKVKDKNKVEIKVEIWATNKAGQVMCFIFDIFGDFDNLYFKIKSPRTGLAFHFLS